ncbi:MAG: hypothetical protein NC038_07715 [Paludibacter sp.]|nr:hypothetical protein [Bacteroidales bacterium]MCM1069949.1 hypothetical protein [Prevotella sp.]MCM1354647.1 hypothetical protein [Bacteroides sp.]MCM1443629.1 hypothetical protein [Muribaculum sp.]MCM1482504.1 hypothetical protein [Paludibacter sp.]
MKHLVDNIVECPYLCQDCKHFISGLQCAAFDVIPLNLFDEPEKHTRVVEGQKGDFIFEPKHPRSTMNVYSSDEDDI